MPSFDFPSRPKKQQEETDRTFVVVLENMLETNETITARAVASRLEGSGLGHASSITRDGWRNNLLNQYKSRQDDLRNLMERADHSSKTNLIVRLEKANAKISELEAKVDLLTASHRAMIHAVGEVGGMRAWSRFFEGYQAVLDRLHEIGAMPRSTKASVVPFPSGEIETTDSQ